MVNKIFCAYLWDIGTKQNIGLAVSNDGYILATEPSKDSDDARYNLGVSSKKNHGVYNKHFATGFEIQWLVEPQKSREFIAAMKKAHERRQALM